MVNHHKYPIPRVRHHVSPQLYAPASAQRILPSWYPPVITDAPWQDWFGNGRPATVLDLGCGRGGFLLGFAAAHPEHNVLGVEVRQTLVTWINGVIDGEHLPNARAVWYTLANGLEWIAPESIQTAFYLFPDPWPKKRHYKRRAFTPDFVRMITRVLAPGGRLYLATDRPEVDAYQTAVIEATGGLAVSPLHEGASWPFEHRTDQQRFCDRKDIPYAWRFAQR